MNKTIDTEAVVLKTKQQEAAMSRIHRLASELIVKWAKDKNLSTVLDSTDTELARFLFESQMERNSEISSRELRKIKKLNEGNVKFSNKLKDLGGACRASVAANLLDVKRQTINNWQKKNVIISVKNGGESRFPVFQFNGNKITEGVEEVLSLIGDVSGVTKVSFFTAMFFFEDEDINVIDALKKYGVDSRHMSVIRRQAKLFGHQAAH